MHFVQTGLCRCAGLVEQEQWTAALVARDFQRSIDVMEQKAQAFLQSKGNGDAAHLAHSKPASAEDAEAKQYLQNGASSALDKGAAPSLLGMHCL